MAITRRVTARFNKRVRTASRVGASGASPSGDHRDELEVRILPVAETRSGIVATHSRTPRPTHAPTLGSIGLSAHLRDARARAEQILREHPRREESTISTCQVCLLTYPCDAVRAAEDVIAISAKLQVGRLRSSKALLELLNDLVDQGAIDTGLDSPEAGTPGVFVSGGLEYPDRCRTHGAESLRGDV